MVLLPSHGVVTGWQTVAGADVMALAMCPPPSEKPHKRRRMDTSSNSCAPLARWPEYPAGAAQTAVVRKSQAWKLIERATGNNLYIKKHIHQYVYTISAYCDRSD